MVAEGTLARKGEADGPPDSAFPPHRTQEVTRRFRCRGCYSKVCDLLDCPGEGVALKGEKPEKLGEG